MQNPERMPPRPQVWGSQREDVPAQSDSPKLGGGGAKHWKALLLCAGFLTLAGFCESASQPVGVAQGFLAAGKNRNQAVASAAGEFRIVAANLLWAKVIDHYHHQFMASGGDWSKNESLLPLLQTITELDPHFVEAYELMGSEILPRTGKVARGRDILARGIQNNPNEWELYREMAMLYAWYDRQPDKALPYAERGLAQTKDDFSRRMMAKLCETLRERGK